MAACGKTASILLLMKSDNNEEQRQLWAATQPKSDRPRRRKFGFEDLKRLQVPAIPSKPNLVNVQMFRALSALTKKRDTKKNSSLERLPRPPVPRLLKSNKPPSEAESTLVYNAIEEAQCRISHLRQRLFAISGLDPRDRTEVKVQLKDAMEFVRQHRGIVSIVRRRGIPPEILQEIFDYLVPMFWLDTPEENVVWNYDKAVKDLWAMTRVCRLWRESAMCMPSFCGQLPSVRVKSGEPKEHTKRRMRIFREFLHRSSDALLNILIFIEDSDSSQRVRNPILDLVLSTSRRWRHLVVVSDIKVLEFHFQSLKGKIPMLQSLTMITIGAPMLEVPALDMFKKAPALKQVCFRGHTSLYSKLNLPQSQLVYFSDDCELPPKDPYTPTGVQQALKLPNSLEILVIGMDRLSLVQVELNGNLPNPRKLYIKMPSLYLGRTTPEVHEWISSLKMEQLYIDARDGISKLTQYSAVWISNVLPNHASQSLTHLSLRIHFAHRSSQIALSYLLDYTPALIRLDITLPSAEDILRLASRYPSGDFSVPNLKICNFYAEDKFIPRKTRNAINALARSRCECRLMLQELAIYFAWTRIGVTRATVSNFEGSLRCKELNLEQWHFTRELDQLEIFKLRLCYKVLEIVGKSPSVKSFDFGQLAENAHKILDDIGAHPVDCTVNLFASDLHLVLKKISDGQVPQDEQYHFSDHARQILDSWRPSFEASLRDRRWMARGKSSLVYIPYHDPFRESPEYYDAMIYGSAPKIPTGPVSEIWPEILNN
ncbi:hypothetical protein BDN70DRAFT_891988 [Pholiota conissans]|uniref:F-box domain-containing protein n=1 Tax=Pholiota conissans TaxID=109636 RepID=A0A9P5ZBW6_9AGAR|nr:hypothetical protein BDN70DRAFT_891988 [Pholiota conissans]